MSSSGGGRTVFFGVAVVVVFIMVCFNLSGEKNSTSRITAEEVALLRERVADLEAKLGAVVSSNRGARSQHHRG